MDLAGKPARPLQDFTGQFSQTAALPLGEQRFHRAGVPVNFHNTEIPKIFTVLLTRYQYVVK
jgi:hypothetical protein